MYKSVVCYIWNGCAHISRCRHKKERERAREGGSGREGEREGGTEGGREEGKER